MKYLIVVSALMLTACGRKAIEEGTCTEDDDANFALCVQSDCSAYKSNSATGMDSCEGTIEVLAQAGSGSCSFSGSGSCEVVCDCGDFEGDVGGSASGSGSGSSGSGSGGGSTPDMCDDICTDLWPCIWGDTHASVDCSTCDGWSDSLVDCLYDCGSSCDCAVSECGMTVLGQ